MSDGFTDRLGNIVKIGDYIVYGNNVGRCAKTAIGQLLSVKMVAPRFGDGDLLPILTVMSIQDDHWRWEPYAKKVTLREAQRVLKYAPSLVSTAMKHVLDAGELKE